MKKYKSNVTGDLVEAVQWDGSGAPPSPAPETSGIAIIKWVRETSSEPDGGVTRNAIHLPHGKRAFPLDFIVKESGGFKVYTPEVFATEFTEWQHA